MNKVVACNIILGICIIVFAILFTVTFMLVKNSRKKLNNYIEGTGVIKDFYENTSMIRRKRGQIKAISPVVSYTVENKDYSFIGNYCTTPMRVGDTVKIMYDKLNPEKATIKNGLYVGPVITGVLSLVFLMWTIILVILRCIIF